jgi:hypothetical protein
LRIECRAGLGDHRREEVGVNQRAPALLEHVRPESPFFGLLFDLLSPVTRRLMGPELNRRTEANVEAAGLTITNVRRNGIWREITARE